MKRRTLNEYRQEKESYYQHPYQTKGINVKDLFALPIKYSNDAELGKAFREMIAEAGAVDYAKKYSKK